MDLSESLVDSPSDFWLLLPSMAKRGQNLRVILKKRRDNEFDTFEAEIMRIYERYHA